MNKHFNIGIKTGIRLWRICLIVYVILLLLAIPFGMQVYQVVDASIGNSLELNKLLLDYNHTVYSDFLNKHGASITPIIGQLRWLILVYFIVSVFLNAGILFCIDRKNYQWSGFWQGASIYFVPFLKLALSYFMLLILWSAIIWIPVLKIFQVAEELLPSEKTFLLICLLALLLFISGLMYLFNASLSSRFHFLNGNKTWFTCLKNGLAWAFKHYLKSTKLLLIFIISLILILILYLFIENNPGMVSAILVLVYFVLQQLFVLFKIFWRVSTYSGFHSLFRKTQS